MSATRSSASAEKAASSPWAVSTRRTTCRTLRAEPGVDGGRGQAPTHGTPLEATGDGAMAASVGSAATTPRRVMSASFRTRRPGQRVRHRAAWWLWSGVVTLASCLYAHPAPLYCAPGVPCPEGQGCDRSTMGLVCVDLCDPLTDGPRCDNGAACYGVAAGPPGLLFCRAGGSRLEEDDARGAVCAFGLAPAADYATDPLIERCQPVCESDAHCRAGEWCTMGRCAPDCDVPGVCGAGNTCVWGRWCVNARRLGRLDCDGDGAPDCLPFGQCDASAIGGCAHPPPEEL